MKKLLSLSLAALASCLFPQTTNANEYIWTPTFDQSGTGGGSGTWINTTTPWYDILTGNTVNVGTSLAAGFGSTGPNIFHFYGSGTVGKQATSYVGGNFIDPASLTMKFHGGNYTLQAITSAIIQAGTGDEALVLDVAASSTLTMSGTGTDTTNLFRLTFGGTSSTVTGGAELGGQLVIQGGGVVIFGTASRYRTYNGWSQMVIRDDSTVIMTQYSSSEYQGDATHTGQGRVLIESGTMKINGGTLLGGYNTHAAPDPSMGFGVAIGAGAGAGQGVLDITSGVVRAYGDPRATGPYGGIVFGLAATDRGGVLNMSGGTLEVSGIRSNTEHDIMNLSGGTIRVTTGLSHNPNFASTGGTATPGQIQSRLDNFITGFSGVGVNFINITGLVTIDLSGIAGSSTVTIDSAIRGSGTLATAATTNADRTLVLRGENSLDWVWARSGTIIGDSKSLGNIRSDASSTTPGAIIFDQDFDGQFFGDMSQMGGFFRKTGSGLLDIVISNTSFTGGGSMYVDEGALQFSGSVSLFTKIIVNSSTIIFDPVVDSVYSGAIRVGDAPGTLIKRGDTALSLTGANTYTGQTIVESGTLIGALNTVRGNYSITGAAAVLLLDISANGTYSGTLDGTGTFQKQGAATLTMAGDSSGFAGTMFVETGTLAGTTRSLAGNLRGAAATSIIFNQNFDGIFSGALIGDVTIRKQGTGALFVTGSASGNPAVFVDAGRLLLSGNNAFMGGGTTTIMAGAAAGGNGTFDTLVAEAGATVQIGGDAQTAPETLTVPDLLTVGGATLHFDLFDNNTSDFLNANAVTNLGGNIIEIGSFVTGTFMLGSVATGTLADSSLMIDGLIISAGSRRSGTLADNGGLQLITTAGNSLNAIWLGTTNGIWNAIDGNWDSDAQDLFATGDRVIFDDTVEASAVVHRAINIVAPGVRVSDMLVSGTGAYTFTGAGIIADADEAVGLAGATGKLVKTGAGTLTLDNGANDFRGGVELGGGVLALGAGVTLGGGTVAVTAADTTLRALGNATLGNDFALAAHGLAVDTGANNLALDGRITGASTLTKHGAGVLVLSGSNNFSGVDLASGTLAVAHATAAGASLKAAADGAALRFDADGIALASAIDLTTHGLGIDTAGHAASLAGALSGTGALGKTGSGTLALTADNSAFTGAVSVGQGALQVVSLGNLGSGSAGLTIAADAALLLRQATTGDVTFARALAGGGILDLELASVTSRFAFAPSAGGAFSGTVAMGRGAFNLDTGNVSALSNATLALNPNSTATVETTGGIAGLRINGGLIRIEMDTAGAAPMNMLGAGHLDVTSGTVALNLSLSGSTPIINPGNPSIFEQSQLSEIKLIAADTVSGVGNRLSLVQMDGSAYAIPVQVDIEQNTAAGPEVVGKADYSYIAEAAEGGLYLGAGLTKIDIHENKILLLDNAGAATSDFKARLTGAGGLEIRATGTITLSHDNNDFAGPASLTTGILKLTKANALAASGAVTLAQGTLLDATDLSQELGNLSGGGNILIGTGTLTLRSTEDTVYEGNIEGTTAQLIKTGGASVLIIGNNVFSGGLDVREGTLHAIGDNSYGTGALAVSAGATLALENINRDFDTAITGGGALALINSRARLGATNTLSSVALRNNAFVQIANAGALGGTASSVSVSGGSTLELLAPGSGTMTVNAGSVLVDGGKLLFGQNTVLNTAGTVDFTNHGAVGLGGPLPTGSYTLITTGSGITSDNPATNLPDYNPREFGMGVQVLRDGRNLVMNIYNQAVNPAKDVAMAYDTILAAMSAVGSRMSESFLPTFTGRKQKDPARNFWLKAFGTIGDYEQTPMQIGFTDRTHGMMAGYDRVLGEKFLIGAWAGVATGEIKTANLAATDASQQLLGIYSALRQGRWHLGMDVAAGFVQARTTRHEHTGMAQGYYETAYVATHMELGFLLGSWERGMVRPSASIYFMNLNYKRQWEKGAGAVRVEDFAHDIMQSLVKLQATQGFDLPWLGWPAAVDASIGWRQNLNGGDCPVRFSYVTNPGTFIDEQAGGYVRGSAVLGLGLRAAITKMMSFGIDYDFEVAAFRQRHTVTAAVRWSW